MDTGIVSVRYAKSLLDFATGNGEEEVAYRQMTTLSNNFQKLPELRATLLNPVVSNHQKVSILKHACTKEVESVCKSVGAFIDLVVDNNREELLQFMANSYLTLFRKQRRLIRATITVASPISDTTIGKFKNIVSHRADNSNVEFLVRVDPSIEGGYILEYDNYMLDQSVRSRLSAMRKILRK